ncbi:MAG: hypothetical protein ACRBG0_26860 [Lewinella sp.]|uniref:hypothetical protein n=1 Tax=Lewinella sp. TaxID=2004506 RepID=UPI003D6BB226
MDIQNILSFGAKKRIEKRLAQYHTTFEIAKKEHKQLASLRDDAVTHFRSFVDSQQKTMQTIKGLRTIYFKKSQDDKIIIKLLKQSLRKGRKNLLELNLSEQQIYLNAVSKLSYSESLGITVAGLTVGAGVAIGVAQATAVSAGTSLTATAGTSLAVSSTGIGSLSWMSIGAIALPVSLLAMWGFNTWNANEKIKKIDEAEKELISKIDEYRVKQNESLALKGRSIERKECLITSDFVLSSDFKAFYAKCVSFTAKLSRWQRFIVHVCLVFGISYHLLEDVRAFRNRLQQDSANVYDLMTKAVA